MLNAEKADKIQQDGLETEKDHFANIEVWQAASGTEVPNELFRLSQISLLPETYKDMSW